MEGIPEDAEAARAELADIDAWLKDYSERTQQLQLLLQRAGFLNGYLAGLGLGQTEPTDTE
jgi:hypothetical protein